MNGGPRGLGRTVRINELKSIRGVALPASVRFRQILVCGPPCSGKSTLVTALRGWPDEGYIDFAQRGWWRQRMLAFRPREIHCGLPYLGHRESLAVFDREWLDTPPSIDFDRIRIPREKRRWWQVDWRRKYVFDIQVPPAPKVFAILRERARTGSHPVDQGITLEQVRRQLEVHGQLARFLHESGLQVHVRMEFGGAPRRIASSGGEEGEGGSR